ncbi:hypothetical protein PV328_012214, partial [Microctonus aethiopoides]
MAEHVRDVEEHRKCNQSYLIKSRVIRQESVNSTPYITSLNIDETRLVTDVKCVCIYNQSKKCKHIAALIYFINNEESVSKTSHEQVWGKPSARQFAKNKYAKGKHFEEMFPSKRGKYYEAPGIDISKMIEESALKHVMVAKAANTNIYTVKRVMDSLLQQVEIDLEKEDCEQCAINFLISCYENTQYKNHF